MTQLVKVGGAMADGERFARRIRQLLEQRDAAWARIEADFRQRIKAIVDESHATSEEPPVVAATA